jgi:predicted O-methyltransferase YrrM
MVITHEAPDWRHYRMVWHKPHRRLEPEHVEIAVVDRALETLVRAGVLSSQVYDLDKMVAHREAVRERFDIPWTAITPRVHRLLYAVNAIRQPAVMVAIGIFCGNTFIANAGAAIGPGASYEAERLIGLEIRPHEAARARRNVATVDGDDRAEIIAADGLDWLVTFDGQIDLLYLDADGPAGRGKSIYLDLLTAALPALLPGSLIIAHNSLNSERELSDYLEFVRDPARFHASVNVVVDDQGVEITRV